MIDQERGTWTSASNAEADYLCPARHQRQQGLPQPEAGEDATSGSVVHALWSGTTPDRDPFPEEIDKADSLRATEVEAVHAYFGQDAQTVRLVEQRLWFREIPGHNPGEMLAHSGRFDVVHYQPQTERALILDGKSGWGEVTANPRNRQLRRLAALLHSELGCGEIAVSILKPHGRQEPACIYTTEDLQAGFEEMVQAVRASHDPKAKAVAGDLQCKYCRAAHANICPERKAWVSTALPEVSPPLPMVTARQWTPEQRAVFCERHSAAAKWLEDRKDEIKSLLQEDPASVPGWGLKPGRITETVINPAEVHARFCANIGGTTEQFLPCIKVGKTSFKDCVRSVTKHKGKQLDQEVEALLAGCCESKESAPTIVKMPA